MEYVHDFTPTHKRLGAFMTLNRFSVPKAPTCSCLIHQAAVVHVCSDLTTSHPVAQHARIIDALLIHYVKKTPGCNRDDRPDNRMHIFTQYERFLFHIRSLTSAASAR